MSTQTPNGSRATEHRTPEVVTSVIEETIFIDLELDGVVVVIDGNSDGRADA